jgi:hypothetical protein
VENITENYIENIVSAVEAEFEVHDEVSSDFEFLKLDEKEIMENGKLVVSNGLESQVISALEKLKVTRINEGGLSTSMLRSYFNGYSKIEEVVRMIDHGPLVHQRVDWRPNGAAGLNATLQLPQNFVVQNHALAKLQKKGHLLILPAESVSHEEIEKLNFSSHTRAPKYDVNGVRVPEDRICMNGSFGRAGESRNSGLDRKASEVDYPAEELIDVTDLCERACLVKEKYPNEEIHGTLVDYSKAYNLANQSVDTAKLCSSSTKAIIGGVEMNLILIYLVAIFGCADAGNWFAVLARAVSYLHNLIFHSFRYVDDNIIIDIASRVQDSENNLVKHINHLLGKNAVNEEKRIQYKQDLMAIGWKFNFRKDVWKVMPKPKSFRKILHSLFVIVKLGSKKVSNKELEKVAGILNWYMKVIPAGQGFVRSLYNCIDWSRHKRKVDLSGDAQQDLLWLRAIVVLSQINPEILCADIDMVRRNKVSRYSIWGDASTSVGGGSYLCNSMKPSDVLLEISRVRWTLHELNIFDTMNVSINVMEYFQEAYSVLLWGNRLSGNIVHVYCDNTAAVSWINKSRGNVNAVGLMPLLRLLTIYCFIKKITLISSHIPGVENILADKLSRELFDSLQEGKAILEIESWWKNLSRQDLCRRLLEVAIVKPNWLHSNQLLGPLRALLSDRG